MYIFLTYLRLGCVCVYIPAFVSRKFKVEASSLYQSPFSWRLFAIKHLEIIYCKRDQKGQFNWPCREKALKQLRIFPSIWFFGIIFFLFLVFFHSPLLCVSHPPESKVPLLTPAQRPVGLCWDFTACPLSSVCCYPPQSINCQFNPSSIHTSESVWKESWYV